MAPSNGPKWLSKLIFSVMILFAISGLAPAATFTVQAGESIQAAIEKASPGDVIEVMSGTYKESVTIDRPLTLVGIDSGEGMPVIDAGSIFGSVYLIENGCQLMGFRILNLQGHGIDVNSNHNKIANNTIEACGASIYLGGANSNIVSHNDAKISCQGLIGLLPSDAIQLMDSNDNIIEGNTASDAWIGIYLMHSHNNTVRENNAHGNDHGIASLGSNRNNIRENNASDNKEEGIGFLDGCTDNILTENTATGNAIGILLQDSNNNTIYLNDFINNEQNARSTKSKNSWYSPEPMSHSFGSESIPSRLGNHWSDFKGVDSNGDGVGDTSYSFEGSQDDYPLMKRWAGKSI